MERPRPERPDGPGPRSGSDPARRVGHVHGSEVVVETDHFDSDLDVFTGELDFVVDAIFPADDPSTAVLSGHGTTIRLVGGVVRSPARLRLVVDSPDPPVTLPGGSTVEFAPRSTPLRVPENRPSLTVSHDDGDSGVGRAGMLYRDLLPDRWGGRFISSMISVPTGGPVPDYVHHHGVRFQLIFVRRGWVRVVYEAQGEPFVLNRGDCVIQPPHIRHRVLEASPGLEVVEIGCPAEHETLADHAMTLPDGIVDPNRTWEGQRFVRHIASSARHVPWRTPGWECRETGVSDATGGLAGVRVARPMASSAATEPVPVPPAGEMCHDHEFAQLVVVAGSVTFETPNRPTELLRDGSAVALPGATPYRLVDPSDDCELLDVTFPGTVANP